MSALKRLVKRQKSDKRKEEDRKKDKMPDLEKKPPVFKNGGSLRDYQRTVRFFRPCIPLLRMLSFQGDSRITLLSLRGAYLAV